MKGDWVGVAAGDREFEAFVAARSPALLRTAYLVTGDEPTAIALLRGALVDTVRAWRRLDGAESAEPYVRRVMLTTRAASTPDAVSTPLLLPSGADRRDLVWAALAELTPRERTVLVLGVRENLDDEEVARLIGCSRQTVQSEGARAFAGVRSVLESAEPGSPTEPRKPMTSAEVSDQVRQTLAAHADDLRPPVGLIDEVHDQAAELRRRRKRRIAVGFAIAAGLVAGVAAVSSLTGGKPPVTSPPSPTSQPSATTLPDSVLRLARENQALVAFGSSIVDAARGGPIVVVSAGPSDVGIQAVTRAEGGYVVTTRSAAKGKVVVDQTLSYVRPDGAQVELGRMSDSQSGFAVSPDGLSVVHAIAGPIEGDNALATGQSELVVQTLAGDVVNRITVDGPVLPLAVDAERVWFARLVDPGGPPYVWERESGTVAQLDIPASEVALAVRGDVALVRDESGSTCLVAFDVNVISEPTATWRRCPSFAIGVLDTSGSQVASVRETDGKAELVVLDAGSGVRVYGVGLGTDPVIQVAWTASGRILVTSQGDGVVREETGFSYSSVQAAQSPGGLVLTTAAYRVPEGLVIFGVESPSPTVG